MEMEKSQLITNILRSVLWQKQLALMQQAIPSVSQANTSMKKRGLYTTTTVTTILNSADGFHEIPLKNKVDITSTEWSETIRCTGGTIGDMGMHGGALEFY